MPHADDQQLHDDWQQAYENEQRKNAFEENRRQLIDAYQQWQQANGMQQRPLPFDDQQWQEAPQYQQWQNPHDDQNRQSKRMKGGFQRMEHEC